MHLGSRSWASGRERDAIIHVRHSWCSGLRENLRTARKFVSRFGKRGRPSALVARWRSAMHPAWCSQWLSMERPTTNGVTGPRNGVIEAVRRLRQWPDTIQASAVTRPVPPLEAKTLTDSSRTRGSIWFKMVLALLDATGPEPMSAPMSGVGSSSNPDSSGKQRSVHEQGRAEQSDRSNHKPTRAQPKMSHRHEERK
jgi:hypothetical protein